MPRIIIIDDDPFYRELISNSIRFYHKRETETYESAFEFLKERAHSINEHELILTDMMMPGMTGTELIRYLRRKGFGGYACIVTGAPEYVEMDIQQHGDISNTDVLKKPFNKYQLNEIIDNWTKLYSRKQ